MLLSERGESDTKPDLIAIERGVTQEDKIEATIQTFSEFDGARLIHYYAAHERMLGMARRAVKKFAAKDKVIVRPLPPSKQAREREREASSE
jgi:hypothetical protein